jgi:transcriptional regulator with XRE-family HTH domain
VIPKNPDPQFPDRLARQMQKKGWNQSDLAKALWGTTFERRNGGTLHEVARNRQTVGNWLKGKGLSEDNKHRLCEVLRVPFYELFPLDRHENRDEKGIRTEDVDHQMVALYVDGVHAPRELAEEIVQALAKYAR